ncbi:MAG: hypothetical protein KY410_03435, partial [Proteobacteria bacterium]|nr:hypothetical protein [Pseudomonadota bacterium]
MSEQGMIVVLVHGWSVRNTDTYGELPARLRSEARKRPDLDIDVRNVWLSRYISFHNEVRLEDISRAFEAALRRELGYALGTRRVAIVTHSTGGPVVRDWMHRFYLARNKRLPASHLVMLAPANFGSPLAQLGRSRLARLKTWFNGVEPGMVLLCHAGVALERVDSEDEVPEDPSGFLYPFLGGAGADADVILADVAASTLRKG